LAKEDLLNLRKYLIKEFDELIVNETIDKLIVNIKNIQEYPLLGRPLTILIDISTE